MNKIINTILAIIILPLIAWLIQQNISLRFKELQLENLKQELTELKKEDKNIKEQLSKYTNSEKVLAKYTFDQVLGVYQNKNDNLFYCPRCLLKDNIETPLHETARDLWCNICSFHCSVPESYLLLRDIKATQKTTK